MNTGPAYDKWNPTMEEIRQTFYRFPFYRTKGGVNICASIVIEYHSEAMKLKLGQRFNIVGVILKNEQKVSKWGNKYNLLTVEHRDGPYNYNYRGKKTINAGTVYIITGLMGEYAGYPSLDIDKVDELVDKEGAIKLVNNGKIDNFERLMHG